MGEAMSERIGHIVERKYERIGRIYPIELKVSKHSCKNKVEDKE
jgi:hypothetical protein